MTWKYYLSETTALYMIALKVGVVTKFCMRKLKITKMQHSRASILQPTYCTDSFSWQGGNHYWIGQSIKASNQSKLQIPVSINCCHQARHCLPGDGCPSPVPDLKAFVHTGALHRHCLNTMLNKVCWIPNVKLDLILVTLNSCHASLTPNYPLLQWI